MSLSKDCLRRDSFSDRVCDDLAEVVLQFLPFEDKFRLECVSKQFQRTVFEKQRELVIDKILLFRGEQRKAMNCKQYNERSLSLIENVLKKLPKICCLSQKRFCETVLNNRDIELIARYCRYLSSIHCDFSQISNIGLLVEKLPKIVSFSADITFADQFRHSFPQIQELNCITPYYTSSLTFPFISELRMRGLKRLSVELNDSIGDHLIGFQEFVDNNRSLTHLCLDLNIMDKNVRHFAFDQIPRLNNLTELKMKSRYKVVDICLINCLKQMSVKCPKLNSLSLSWLFIEEMSEFKDIFNELKKLKHLKRLSIEMFGLFSDNIKGIEVYLNDSLKSMKELKELKIFLPKMYKIDNILVNDFDKYLPKLKNLVICGQIGANEGTAHILSRLPRLESIDLKVTELSVGALIERQVINNCRQIESIIIGV